MLLYDNEQGIYLSGRHNSQESDNNDASEKQACIKNQRRNYACEMEGGGGTMSPTLCHGNVHTS